MSSEFAPIILLIFFWIFVGVPLSIAKKASQQKKAARPNTVKQQPAETPGKKRENADQPERLTTLTPSIAPSGLTMAGDEDFAPRTVQARPGIPLGWTNNDVVRGIVMSEILNRKKK